MYIEALVQVGVRSWLLRVKFFRTQIALPRGRFRGRLSSLALLWVPTGSPPTVYRQSVSVRGSALRDGWIESTVYSLLWGLLYRLTSAAVEHGLDVAEWKHRLYPGFHKTTDLSQNCLLDCLWICPLWVSVCLVCPVVCLLFLGLAFGLWGGSWCS